MEELKAIMQKFAASGWDLIAVPAQEWLDGKADKDTLVSAIKQSPCRTSRKVIVFFRNFGINIRSTIPV